MDKVSAVTRKDVMEELAQSLPDMNALKDDEFTVSMFAEHLCETGRPVSRKKAQTVLLNMYKDGVITRRWVFHDGGMCYAYKR